MSKKGQHTSVDRELKQTIRWLESFDCVSRVVLGLAESARHSFTPGVIKIQMEVPGGLKIKGYGGRGVQSIYIKIDPEHKQYLIDKINERYPT